jgi:hypothetical protein
MLSWLLPLESRAELPATSALLDELGVSASEKAQIQSGSLIKHSIKPTSDREITTGIAFAVPIGPSELLADAKKDLFDAVDPTMISYGQVSDPAQPADFAKLVLRPDQLKALRAAEPGDDFQRSTSEIAKFEKLGPDASDEAITQAVREMLAARANAYRKRGLAGTEPYALSSDTQRSPADEIKAATQAAVLLEKYAPETYAYLLDFPKGAPTGAQSAFRWSFFEGHGVPTIVLTHMLMIPDGDAWILAKRQYYVSSGYNAEQEVGSFLPEKNGGTVVVYVNRTSTDQVTGFGGSAKRSIGSSLLASQIEALFEKARERAK